VDNQHRLIKGYRDLTPEEVSLINDIKSAGYKVDALLDSVRHELINQFAALPVVTPLESEQHTDAIRWMSIARTHLQQGFMALTRAVAKPTGF
jgi:hypothetical protein